MAFKRTERVGDLLQREIGEIIEKELKDPRIGMATITAVTVSADLKHARVYYSVLGDDRVRQQTERGLESAKFFIQGEIGRRLRLKYTPELTFTLDESIQRGFYIDKLLRKIHEGDDEGHEGGGKGP